MGYLSTVYLSTARLSNCIVLVDEQFNVSVLCDVIFVMSWQHDKDNFTFMFYMQGLLNSNKVPIF